MRQCGALSLLLLTAVWSPPCAAESPNPRPYAESVLQDRPVAYWRLDDNLLKCIRSRKVTVSSLVAFRRGCSMKTT